MKNEKPKKSAVKTSTRNEARGKFDEVAGGAMEKAGRLTGNTDLEAKGTVRKVSGKVQKKVGQIGKVFGR